MSDDKSQKKGKQIEEQKHESNEYQELKKQIEEYKSKYFRALADYNNLEKRVLQQKEEWSAMANKRLIIKLLEFLDNLDKAEIFIKDEHLKLIKNSFQKVLGEEGLKEIEVLGKEYDPYTAEVIDMVVGDKENIVVDVLRKGYELHGSVIRVAQVKVSKKGN